MTIAFYHNPRCNTSRTALKLLRDAGADVRVIEYLKTPPSGAEITRLAGMIGVPVKGLVRKKEAAAAGVSLDQPDAALLRAIAEHPIILERPIAVKGGKAVLGRPAEKVLGLV